MIGEGPYPGHSQPRDHARVQAVLLACETGVIRTGEPGQAG
jgi:hypothetical protein